MAQTPEPKLYRPAEVSHMLDPYSERVFTDSLDIAQFRNRVQREENQDPDFVKHFRMWLEFQNPFDRYPLSNWLNLFMEKVIQ